MSAQSRCTESSQICFEPVTVAEFVAFIDHRSPFASEPLLPVPRRHLLQAAGGTTDDGETRPTPNRSTEAANPAPAPALDRTNRNEDSGKLLGQRPAFRKYKESKRPAPSRYSFDAQPSPPRRSIRIAIGAGAAGIATDSCLNPAGRHRSIAERAMAIGRLHQLATDRQQEKKRVNCTASFMCGGAP